MLERPEARKVRIGLSQSGEQFIFGIDACSEFYSSPVLAFVLRCPRQAFRNGKYLVWPATVSSGHFKLLIAILKFKPLSHFASPIMNRSVALSFSPCAA